MLDLISDDKRNKCLETPFNTVFINFYNIRGVHFILLKKKIPFQKFLFPPNQNTGF